MDEPKACNRTGIGQIRILTMLALLLLSSTPACNRGKGAPVPSVTLAVTNSGFYDVNVYVVRSSATTAIRLGMVAGGTSNMFRVSETYLQPGHLMVVQVRTIGATASWTSPSLAIGRATMARLDVVTASNGGLTQTQFYTQR